MSGLNEPMHWNTLVDLTQAANILLMCAGYLMLGCRAVSKETGDDQHFFC